MRRIRTDLLTFVGRSSYFAIRYTFYDLKNLPWVTWGVLLQNICMIFVKYFDSLQLVRRFVLIIAIYLLVVNVLRYSTLFLSRARGRRGRNLPPYTFTHSPLGLLQICSEELHKILQCYNSQWNSDETCDVSMLTRARESSHGASQAVSQAPVHNGHCQIVRWTVSAVLSEVKSAVLSTSWSFVL